MNYRFDIIIVFKLVWLPERVKTDVYVWAPEGGACVDPCSVLLHVLPAELIVVCGSKRLNWFQLNERSRPWLLYKILYIKRLQ